MAICRLSVRTSLLLLWDDSLVPLDNIQRYTSPIVKVKINTELIRLTTTPLSPHLHRRHLLCPCSQDSKAQAVSTTLYSLVLEI